MIMYEASLKEVAAYVTRGPHSLRMWALASILETKFGKEWYLWDRVNMRSDKDKAKFARLEIARKHCQDTAREAGLPNPNMPWSAAKQYARRSRLYL